MDSEVPRIGNCNARPLSIAWSWFACLPGGGPDAHPVDLGFLGSWPFRREDPRPGPNLEAFSALGELSRADSGNTDHRLRAVVSSAPTPASALSVRSRAPISPS